MNAIVNRPDPLSHVNKQFEMITNLSIFTTMWRMDINKIVNVTIVGLL